MDLVSAILIIAGLCLFETITSIDNAIINAEVLSTMAARARRWFLTWGILIAVFGIRFLLPWLIVWISTPSLGPLDALTATFSSDPRVAAAIGESAPTLLIGGGTFLVFLFFHWLFLEEKHFGLRGERYIRAKGVWFYRDRLHPARCARLVCPRERPDDGIRGGRRLNGVLHRSRVPEERSGAGAADALRQHV